MDERLQDPSLLREHIGVRLLKHSSDVRFFDEGGQRDHSAAAILFLLGMHRPSSTNPLEACLIFNQRSRYVRQPGDLCFPGGGLAPFLDGFLAGLLRLPGLPLFPWASFLKRRHQNRGKIPRGLSRLLATSLREGFEEMRINPFRIRFLGPMAAEHFRRFNRTIYPMVAWNHGQGSFNPNWEVERIVYIPLRRFLDPGAYQMLSVSHHSRFNQIADTPPKQDFPCLTYENGENHELLWGLTYRIVVRFLDIVFDFKPPDAALLSEKSKQGRK